MRRQKCSQGIALALFFPAAARFHHLYLVTNLRHGMLARGIVHHDFFG